METGIIVLILVVVVAAVVIFRKDKKGASAPVNPTPGDDATFDDTRRTQSHYREK